jgi:hypothetical protein
LPPAEGLLIAATKTISLGFVPEVATVGDEFLLAVTGQSVDQFQYVVEAGLLASEWNYGQ